MIAVTYSDQGAGNDPEAFRLVSLRATFINALVYSIRCEVSQQLQREVAREL